MAYEKKEGDVSIFKNDKKGNDNAPEYTGTALINGEEVRIALWVKDGGKGKFFSGKIEKKEKPETKEVATKEVAKKEDDDDLPF